MGEQTAMLWLSKIGDISIRYHRPIPIALKEVTLTEETTDEWYVTLGLEVEYAAFPEKPDVNDLHARVKDIKR